MNVKPNYSPTWCEHIGGGWWLPTTATNLHISVYQDTEDHQEGPCVWCNRFHGHGTVLDCWTSPGDDERNTAPAREAWPTAVTIDVVRRESLNPTYSMFVEGTNVTVQNCGIPTSIVPPTGDVHRAQLRGLGQYVYESGTFIPERHAKICAS